jgi:hypothetical protein
MVGDKNNWLHSKEFSLPARFEEATLDCQPREGIKTAFFLSLFLYII